MTPKTILIKAIKKAKLSDNLDTIYYLNSYCWEMIIFSHDFAKAFWGVEEVDERGINLNTAWEELWKNEGQHMDKEEFENDFGFDIETKVAWRYHLQQMVLEEEPLKYLEKFLIRKKARKIM